MEICNDPRIVAVFLLIALLGAAQVKAEEALYPDDAYPEDGKDIYMVCAPCHGPEGQGGAKGDYPRLAGLPYEYIQEQLLSFKARERINIPMFPFTVERELNDQDIMDVSAYIAEMELSNRMPEMDEDTDGYVRLIAAKQVLQIPRVPGDVEAGKKFTQRPVLGVTVKMGRGVCRTIRPWPVSIRSI